MTIANDQITPQEDILDQLRGLARQLAAGWMKPQQAQWLTEPAGHGRAPEAFTVQTTSHVEREMREI